MIGTRYSLPQGSPELWECTERVYVHHFVIYLLSVRDSNKNILELSKIQCFTMRILKLVWKYWRKYNHKRNRYNNIDVCKEAYKIIRNNNNMKSKRNWHEIKLQSHKTETIWKFINESQSYFSNSIKLPWI